MSDMTASETFKVGPPPPVRAELRALRPVSVVRPCGDLDLCSAPALGDALAVLVKRGGVIGVDLAAVSFMDAAGLKVLCAAADALGDRGSLALFDPNPQVFRLLMITGLTDLIART